LPTQSRGTCEKVLAMNIKLPLEFKNLYKQDGVSLREVLEGFIRDLCALDGSHGSDERDKAQAYYDRCGLSVPERQLKASAGETRSS
jgi:hypothetical protein